MQQIAVFVDAGYLLAAGGSLLSGSPITRNQLVLEIDRVIDAIRASAHEAAPDSRLLRIYWYDGIALYSGPSAEQSTLGVTANVKLRLGTINSRGQQKGVDSLIITDLIDLARNKAISDALIVAGDEDLRVGVQVAQTYGVRVALLGVEPSRSNQSPQLIQEADALIEWGRSPIDTFLTVRELSAGPRPVTERPELGQPISDVAVGFDFATIVSAVLSRFDSTQLSQFKQALEASGSLPRDIDAPLLGQAGSAIGRFLIDSEKREIRRIAREQLARL